MIILTDEIGKIIGSQVFPNTTKAPHVVVNITVAQAEKLMGLHVDDLSDIEAAIEKGEALQAAKAESIAKAEAIEEARRVRNERLDALTHDFGDGRVIQTRPQDEANILRAIDLLESEGLQSVNWVMLDNKKYPVTLAELKEALRVGRLSGFDVWEDYNP